MLRVTIELLPEGDATLARTLAVMTVVNDDTGTPMNGHYEVKLTYIEPGGSTFTKTARVADFDRDRPAVDLVAAALSVINPLKRGMASFDDQLARYDPAAPYAGEVWAKAQPVGRESGAALDHTATPLEQLRDTVRRYDNPTDPVSPTECKPARRFGALAGQASMSADFDAPLKIDDATVRTMHTDKLRALMFGLPAGVPSHEVAGEQVLLLKDAPLELEYSLRRCLWSQPELVREDSPTYALRFNEVGRMAILWEVWEQYLSWMQRTLAQALDREKEGQLGR